MRTRIHESLATPHVGGRLAVVLFAFALVSFVVESQLTQVSPEENFCPHIHFVVSTVCADYPRLPSAILHLVGPFVSHVSTRIPTEVFVATWYIHRSPLYFRCTFFIFS